ncbi:hypothetical protein FHX10_003016 [Rhizobium sp. BK591]|uniref:hypothetical protein n=1 Tax=Rhizobium sp. BK591 TaxID=2586985 RepID=UPI001607E0FE|nr:hypothetical protein [Rhizobium sp. BK591]MBB3743517.1 hypothetical protein [Rhizobium sp. BK591]
MTTGEEIFWGNARSVLRDIDMQHLDLAHGAAVEIVRWCLVVHGRPTHHRQSFLEQESPALLAYLEKLASSGDAAGWLALRDRVQLHAELLRETSMQPCAKPWLAAIWHTLPELAAIGQGMLDDLEEPRSVADFEAAPVSPDADPSSGGDDDKGSAGNSGTAGTTAKPKPSPRLALPVVLVALTETEKKALGLDKRGSDVEADKDVTPDAKREGPDGSDGPGGMKGGPR